MTWPDRVLARLLCSLAFWASAAYVFGLEAVKVLAPMFKLVAGAVQSDFLPHLEVVESESGGEMRMSAVLLREVPVDSRNYMEVARHVDYWTTDVTHILLPAVFLLAVVLSWPSRGAREWVHRLLLTSVAMILALGCIIPLTLVGRFRMWLVEITHAGPAPAPSDWTVQWALFAEGGGRWLIPVAAGLICIAAARTRQSVLSQQVRQGATSPALRSIQRVAKL